jgi:streptogramin lyase
MLKHLSLLLSAVVLLGLLGPNTWADITEFELPNPNSGPAVITVGPDGNLWFTEQNSGPSLIGNGIGRFNLADNTITEFQLPNANSDPRFLTVGPDNNLWFAEYAGNRIGTITLDGNITEFDLPNPSAPQGITLGPRRQCVVYGEPRQPDWEDYASGRHRGVPHTQGL